MHNLSFLSTICSTAFLVLSARADHVEIFSSSDQALHPTSHQAFEKRVDKFSPAGLSQLTLNAMGVTTGRLSNAEKHETPLLADLFVHQDAYVTIMAEEKDVVDIQNPISDSFTNENTYHQAFDLSKNGKNVPLGVAKAIDTNDINVMCIGDSRNCPPSAFKNHFMDGSVVQSLWKEFTTLERTKEADRHVVEYLSYWRQAQKSITQTRTFVSIHWNVALVHALDASKQDDMLSSMQNELQTFLKTLQSVHQWQMQLIHLDTPTGFSIDTSVQNVVAYSRLLAEISEEESGMADAGSSNVSTESSLTIKESDITIEDIAEYQIILWTSVVLVVVVIMAIVSMATMDTGRDSLLYAKFITDANSRKFD